MVDTTEKIENSELVTNRDQLVVVDNIESLIKVIRGQQVIFDKDLAKLYGVETKYLNKQVKRNIERFPEDFMFQLTKEECLRCQIGTSNEGRGGARYFPYVFTENGVSMLSSVSAVIYTQQIIRRFQLDIDRHNAQYAPIDVETFRLSHDRFHCIDDDVYHIGASIKDLGKKWFTFSKLDILSPDMLIEKIKSNN